MTMVEDALPSIDNAPIANGLEPVIDMQVAKETSAPKASPFDAEFEKTTLQTLKEWHIPGMSIAVIDGKDTWTQGYGYATLPDIPVKPSTLYYTGSTTKSFLAAAAAMLVHDNEKYSHVQWDTPMNELVRDDFVLEDEYATSHVTLEDALSHRTGMPGHTLTFGGNTLKESVRSLRHLYLNKPIRTTWQYCNLMYMAVSHMVEVVTGSWLGDFFKEKIWAPLGMTSTFFRLDDAERYVQHHQDNALATGYSWDKGSGISKPVAHWRDMPVAGAGAIISNVIDYAKYVRSMIEQSGPLPSQAYADLVSPRTIMPPFDPHFSHTMLYSLGWMIGVYHGHTIITHGGGLDGFSSAMMYLPDKKFGIVVLANGQSRGTEDPAWYLIDNLLQVPQEKRINMLEWNGSAQAEAQKQIESAPARLYPLAPSPGLPLTFPLADYTGVYTHPAYRPLVVSVTKDTPVPRLRAVAEGGVKVVLNLRHVTADHFVGDLVLFTHGVEPLAAIKAGFKLDIQGKVSEFGAELEFLSGGGKMIWFKRQPYSEDATLLPSATLASQGSENHGS
ncbi:hypothetical protein LTR10_017648 [Elasticomyces elasticus]|uniref:Beta-lactamase-related domain-containing protein n=1 Tax=Exophiala sideris TaxID=1016849 RepID=A0ABR0JP87_9EURO|nr:hypothetical protein LTR10_017648 [Elasticomyces elasticus]KAK5038293.1 hypothetical protein LTS07_001763 [Exophiala sideris]KAK5044277.1 hypothetical protein LTR13_000633 [Exophiala sideris]KAK5067777.1 hypothetical protein LTR69_001766 [Exophiala sideris]KAK5183983.1 hypothetical protein LTR44_003488 [Eurotiomycetes sp. CCFEE 6388]